MDRLPITPEMVLVRLLGGRGHRALRGLVRPAATLQSQPQPPATMENIERYKFYHWLAEADYDGPVGLTTKFTVEVELEVHP